MPQSPAPQIAITPVTGEVLAAPALLMNAHRRLVDLLTAARAVEWQAGWSDNCCEDHNTYEPDELWFATPGTVLPSLVHAWLDLAVHPEPIGPDDNDLYWRRIGALTYALGGPQALHGEFDASHVAQDLAWAASASVDVVEFADAIRPAFTQSSLGVLVPQPDDVTELITLQLEADAQMMPELAGRVVFVRQFRPDEVAGILEQLGDLA